LRSLLFYLGYSLATVIISIVLLSTIWLIPQRHRFFAFSLWGRFVIFWLRLCCGIRHRVEGLENLPATPVVILSNHQSSWETIFLYQLFSPVCPILKKELLKIPFWGWALRLQQPIAIDRSKPREAGKSLLTQGAKRIKEGASILVFPEGTRAPAGKLGKFSRGGAQLAAGTGTDLIPVLHNAGNHWPAHSSRKYPGTI